MIRAVKEDDGTRIVFASYGPSEVAPAATQEELEAARDAHDVMIEAAESTSKLDGHSFRSYRDRWFPFGVILRLVPEGECRGDPVLVCVPCGTPQLHRPLSPGWWRCRSCEAERRW